MSEYPTAQAAEAAAISAAEKLEGEEAALQFKVEVGVGRSYVAALHELPDGSWNWFDSGVDIIPDHRL